jgi:peptidoglycan/xylan/chitin deacetylase (PgdA/CDA1 family)
MIDALAQKSPLRRAVRFAADAVLPASLLVSRGPADRSRVALTFDDGPDAATRDYLDVLDRFGAAATFFVLGKSCRERGADVLEMIRRGHEMAGHGYTHKQFTSMSRRELAAELSATAALLPVPRGRALVRPPEGKIAPRSLLDCFLAGYTTVLWSLDSGDWHNRTPEAVAEAVAPERVRPGEIVLLHEGQRWTLAALPRILAGLKGAGFELVTVGELLG